MSMLISFIYQQFNMSCVHYISLSLINITNPSVLKLVVTKFEPYLELFNKMDMFRARPSSLLMHEKVLEEEGRCVVAMPVH